MGKYKSYLDTYIEDLLNESRNIVASNINNMLKEQLSNPNYGNRNSECAGTYYVNGYTKEDGTEVEGYMRTCGAEHAGHGSQANPKTPIQEGKITKECYIENNGPVMYTKKVPQPEIYARKNMNPDVATQYHITNFFGAIPIVHQYYKLSLLFADKKSKKLKNKYNNDIYKFNETPEFVDKNYAFNKIKDSLDLDMNYTSDFDKLQNTMVVIPQENAEIINKIKRSPITAQMVKDNIDKIIDGETVNTSIEYNSLDDWNERFLYGIIKKADIRELKLNEDGTISFYVIDMYDFEKLKQDKNADWKKKAFVPINNRAYQQQTVGKLQPYLLYIPITLSVSEILDMVNN